MLRTVLFGFLTVALIPAGSFAQQSVTVVGPVEIRQELPPASRYDELLKTPGRAVISKRYTVGDPSFAMLVRVSFRESAPDLKVYTFHSRQVSVDLEKLPQLIDDLETFRKMMITSEKESEEADLWFRYSDDFYAGFSQYRETNGTWISRPIFRPGSSSWSGEEAKKMLFLYIDGLKQGYSKLQELKRAR